jgi:hypothetical protein
LHRRSAAAAGEAAEDHLPIDDVVIEGPHGDALVEAVRAVVER